MFSNLSAFVAVLVGVGSECKDKEQEDLRTFLSPSLLLARGSFVTWEPMGICRSRAKADPLASDEAAEEEEAGGLEHEVVAWQRLAAHGRRLACLRRLWAALGQYLQEVRRRGREP